MTTVAVPPLSLDDRPPQTRCACGFLHPGPAGTECTTCQATHQALEVRVTPAPRLHASTTTLVMPAGQAAVVPDVAPIVVPDVAQAVAPQPRGRPRNCSLCAHPARAALDAALQAGTSQRVLERQYGYATSTWSRHRARCLGLPPRSPLAGQSRAALTAQRAGRICARTGCGVDISHKLRKVRFCCVRCGVLARMASPDAHARMQTVRQGKRVPTAQPVRIVPGPSFAAQAAAHLAALDLVALEQAAGIATLQAQQARTQRQIEGLRLYLGEEQRR